MDIVSMLKRGIPSPNSTYRLLSATGSGRYTHWAVDRNGVECLYYSFAGGTRHKRLPSDEICAAWNHLGASGRLTRKDFEEFCPTANNAGTCGYAALIRAFEAAGQGKVVLEGRAWVLARQKARL